MAMNPSSQTDSLHIRDEGGKPGLSTDQIIAIISIIASIFGVVILFEIVAQAKRARLRAKKKRAGLEAGAVEAPLELEVSGGFSGARTSNFTGHAPPALPEPVVPAQHAAGSWPERGGGQDNYPRPNRYFTKLVDTPAAASSEPQFIWQLHSDSVAVQSGVNLPGRPVLDSQV